jgi:hypothetical protein
LDIADADADVWLAGGMPCLATDRATARICHSLTMRCRFLRPLYRALNNSKSGTAKKAAVETFERNKRSYHPIAGLWIGEACGNRVLFFKYVSVAEPNSQLHPGLMCVLSL